MRIQHLQRCLRPDWRFVVGALTDEEYTVYINMPQGYYTEETIEVAARVTRLKFWMALADYTDCNTFDLLPGQTYLICSRR